SAMTPRPGLYATLHLEDANRGGRWRENSCSDSVLTVGLDAGPPCGHTWARLMVSRTRSWKLQCHSYCCRRFASTAPSARRGGSAKPAGVDAHASTTLIWFPSPATR